MVFLRKNNMILFRYYDKDNRLDMAWYDSSNIVYSECDDNENALKTLRIVFKTGDMYEYKEVDVKDYLMFMAGGVDGSNGKAFYKFIRPKYKFEKKEKVNFDLLSERMKHFKELKLKETQKNEEPEAKNTDS